VSSDPHALQRRYVQQPTSGRREKKTWNAFRLVSTNFLGNIRAENYKELIDKMLLFTNLQNVIKDTNSSFPLGFLPRQLLHGW
jgi:hypothetical protein